jgi:hypothetical protein
MHATPSTLPRAASAPWYKHRWPWFLMIGPVAVVLAGAFTTYLAVSSPDALVVGDYYKQGKTINQDLRRDRAASALRLALQVHYDAKAGKLEGRLESFGQPMTGPFRLLLAHPTLPSKDLALDARPDSTGRFSIDLPGLERTHWQVVVEGGQRDWRLARAWESSKHDDLTITADPL